MIHSLKYLVIDGYTENSRQQLADGGASVAAELYRSMLERWSPCPASCDVLFPSDPGVHLPGLKELERYDGVAWTGCSLGCNDGTVEVERQIQLQRDCYAAGVPGFGSCWAAQIAVVAAGGRVQVNPRGREMGLARKIALTNDGRSHPLHEGRAQVFDAFSSHDDEITHLPDGGLILSGNLFTRVQSVCVTYGRGTVWAVQFHPEYDLYEMARLVYCRIEKLVTRGFFRDRQDALSYVKDLETLHENPARKDLAWRLGIDSDVMDESIRCTEVRNWIQRLVIPTKLAKG